MFRSFLIKISLSFLLILILTGCSPKQEIKFKIEDHFQKVVSIPLTELETQAMNVYTEFGFYAVEPELCKISKYNNAGEYEFSFGKKGRGPGEFEEGIPISYDEEKGIFGIYDLSNSRYCYYDRNGEFLNFETMAIVGRDFFINKQSGLKIRTYLSVKEEIGKYSYIKNLDINGINILSLGYTKNDYGMANPFPYSINNGIIYFLELTEKDLMVYFFQKENELLKEITLTGAKIDLEKGIYNFISYADYLIIMERNGKQHYFDLSGAYMGSVTLEDEHKWFDGAYGDYIYLTIYVDGELSSIDVYKAK